MRRLFIPIVFALLARLGGTAAAQDILVEGPGIKVGEATVLHPHLGLEAGVVSNVFYEEDEEVISPIMRLLAGMTINPAGERRLGDMTESARTLEFAAGVNVQYTEYLTSDDEARKQRNVDVDASAKVQFFPQSNATFILSDSFQRLTRPTNFESSGQLNRDINHFKAEFILQPRGHNISGGPRYENIIDIFESDSIEFANRIRHIIGVTAKWKFFPYTQVYLDSSLGFNRALGDNQVMGMDYKIESNPLRIVAGLDTVLTEWTTINAFLGYANGFYEERDSYNVVVGGVKFGWRFSPTGRVLLTYSYDVHDSINANYYGEHLAEVRASQQISALDLTAAVGTRFRGYRGIPLQLDPMFDETTKRDDVILDARARADWVLQDRYSLYAEYGVQSVDTDFRVVGDDPSYMRHQGFLGIVAAF